MKDFLPFSRTPGTGLSRWNDCLKTIKQIHGNDEAVMVAIGCYFGVHDLQHAGMCLKREWPRLIRWVQI